MRYFRVIALSTFFLFVFSFSKSVFAECAGGFSVWPQSEELVTNPIIVLEGYMNGKDVILGIGERYQLYLLDQDGKKIDLKIQKKIEPGFQMAQLLLKPAESLKVDNVYTLSIDGLSDEDKALFSFPNSENTKFGMGPKKWNVKESVSGKLTFKEKPVFKEVSCRNRGGADEVFANFKIAVNTKDALLYAEMYDAKNKKNKSVFYIISKGSNDVKIGKGMCYGTFDLIRGKTYKIKFKAVNAAGESEIVSSTIAFKTNCPNQ